MEIKVLSKASGIDVNSLTDNPANVLADYETDNQKISFAGDNLKFMENRMNGGLLGDRIYLFGGVPDYGITTLLNNMADNLCLNGVPVLFFCYGVSRSELRYRTFARFSDHPIDDFNNKKVTPDGISEIMAEPRINMISSLKYTCDAGCEIESWESIMEKICTKHHQPPVILVDNLRKIYTPETFNGERFRLAYLLSRLAMMARKYHIPVLIASELSRTHYQPKKEKVTIACFKESVSLEYEAAWIGILSENEEHKTLHCLKANQGTGKKFSLNYELNIKDMVIGEEMRCEEKRNLEFNFSSFT